MFNLDGIPPEHYSAILIKLADMMDIPELNEAIKHINDPNQYNNVLQPLRRNGSTYNRIITDYFDAIVNLRLSDKKFAMMYAVSNKDGLMIKKSVFGASLKRAIPMLNHKTFQKTNNWGFEKEYRKALVETKLRNPHVSYINSFVRFYRYA